jgi:hypothetical protein
MSFQDPARVARVRKCFSDCGRSPANPRIPHGSPEWQPAYNHCTRGCSQSGEYRPYNPPPKRKTISTECVQQMQYEAMGETPERIKSFLNFYDPHCGDAWQYTKYAGRRRPLSKKGAKLRAAIRNMTAVTLKRRV